MYMQNTQRHDKIHDPMQKTQTSRKSHAMMLNKWAAPLMAVSRPVETTRASHCLGVVYG